VGRYHRGSDRAIAARRTPCVDVRDWDCLNVNHASFV
jgi:hypothetical protein